MKSHKIPLKHSLISLLGALLLTACSEPTPFKKVVGSTMGTTYTLMVQIENQNIDDIYNAIEAELADINTLMSTYIKDSEINRFNQLTTKECFPFSDKTWQVIQAAKKVYHETDGAFDITLGPLISRWGFSAEEYEEKVPNEQEIMSLTAMIGFEKLQLDAEKQCIVKTIPSMTINLSAIAKGFAVDQLASILDRFDVKNYYVDIGGEVKAKGLKNYNKHWKIAVEKPNAIGQRSSSIVLNLFNTSVATSGNYRNYFEVDGKRFSHTINPKTGYPVTHNMTSVSVIHKSNMMADAYATAINVMGMEQAYEFAKKRQLPIYTIHQKDNQPIIKRNKLFEHYISQ